MTHDPETAERLVAILTPLITEQSCGEWDDKTINEDVQMFLPPLLTALQEARNAALREAADLCVEYSTHHGTGMFDKHSHACSEAILALIDTPAPPPPAPPAGDVLRMSQTLADIAAGRGMFGIDLKADLEWAMWEARAALAAAPAPIQPAPQPDADEREAMVAVILDAMLGRYPGRDMARAVADALLAAGWARKREGE